MPFPFSKATVYTNGTCTPMLIAYPGMGQPRTFKQLTANIDILPTLLDLLGVRQPDGIDGRSWAPLMRGHHAKDRDYVVTHVNTVNSGAAFPMRAIQNERYSLIFSPWSDGTLHFQVESMEGLTYKAMRTAADTDPRIAARVNQYILGIPLAFYDLAVDPDERVNRIDSSEHRREIETMKRRATNAARKAPLSVFRSCNNYHVGERNLHPRASRERSPFTRVANGTEFRRVSAGSSEAGRESPRRGMRARNNHGRSRRACGAGTSRRSRCRDVDRRASAQIE